MGPPVKVSRARASAILLEVGRSGGANRPLRRSIRTPRSANFERFIPDCVQFSPVANNTKGPANGSPAELKPLTVGLQYSRALMRNRALLNQNEESALYLIRRGGLYRTATVASPMRRW